VQVILDVVSTANYSTNTEKTKQYRKYTSQYNSC